MPTLCFQVLRNARSSKPPFSRSTSAPKSSPLPFPLASTNMHAAALLRAVVCVRLFFAKTFRIPSRGIIEFRMYKYHQPWTIGPLVCPSYMYTKEKAVLESYPHLGWAVPHTTPVVCGRHLQLRPLLFFGPFVASWAPSLPPRVKK